MLQLRSPAEAIPKGVHSCSSLLSTFLAARQQILWIIRTQVVHLYFSKVMVAAGVWIGLDIFISNYVAPTVQT